MESLLAELAFAMFIAAHVLAIFLLHPDLKDEASRSGAGHDPAVPASSHPGSEPDGLAIYATDRTALCQTSRTSGSSDGRRFRLTMFGGSLRSSSRRLPLVSKSLVGLLPTHFLATKESGNMSGCRAG